MAPTFTAVPVGFEIETVLVASTKANARAATSDANAPHPASPQPAATGKSQAADSPWDSVANGGVNGALLQFGDFLLARHNKTRARGDHKVESEYIGYSTTGFYFYNLCDCLDTPAPSPFTGGKPDPHNRRTCVNSPIAAKYLQKAATPGVCASYADTLIAANEALKAQGIAIRHFLLDS
jgi:hypothetical protein